MTAADPIITPEEDAHITELVDHFKAHSSKFALFLEQLRGIFTDSAELRPRIHSVKWRVKDAEHLRDKLRRKLVEAKAAGGAYDISAENLFKRINDLAGFRILHLHTRQMDVINKAILACLEEARCPVIEGPIAKTWDDESRAYFKAIGIETEESTSLYTSVHYVVESNTKKQYTCEIQVRTLAEELWGEVDHALNYPLKSKSVACREQIAVLARVTSSCTRLVDAIFRSDEDSKKQAP